jgi:hypothetical protein
MLSPPRKIHAPSSRFKHIQDSPSLPSVGRISALMYSLRNSDMFKSKCCVICDTSSGANHTSPSTLQHLPHAVHEKFKPSSYQGSENGRESGITRLSLRIKGLLFARASAWIVVSSNNIIIGLMMLWWRIVFCAYFDGDGGGCLAASFWFFWVEQDALLRHRKYIHGQDCYISIRYRLLR